MNYKKHYNNLIEKAKNRKLNCYKERHHIIPKCMGGTDDKENIVDLTPEEHYIAHQLLIKIYPNHHGLIKAAAMMIPNRPSNKLYGWIKRKLSQVQSNQQSGKRNSQYGTCWITNIEEKISIKIKKKDLNDYLAKGWIRGRNIKKIMCKGCDKDFLPKGAEIYCSEKCKIFNKCKITKKYNKRKIMKKYRKKTKKCKGCEKEFLQQKEESYCSNECRSKNKKYIEKEKKIKDHYISLYQKFLNGDWKSIRDFARSEECKVSHVMLTKMWKKHIDTFNPTQGKKFKS